MHARLMAAVECRRITIQVTTRNTEPATNTNTEMTMKVSKYFDSTRWTPVKAPVSFSISKKKQSVRSHSHLEGRIPSRDRCLLYLVITSTEFDEIICPLVK